MPPRSSSSSSFGRATRTLSARKERPLTPADLFANWEGVAARLDQATHLVALGLDDDGDGAVAQDPGPAPRTTHVRSQPTVAMHGRVADWVAEIRRLRDGGETTLFVAATAGRAERIIELLKEYEVLAVPVDRADDARYAAVLVATGILSRGISPARRRAADLRRSRRLRGGAARRPSGGARRPKRFCRISAISRSTISSSTSITASGRSSA